MKIYKYLENEVIKLAFCECVLSQASHVKYYGENTVELSAANYNALGDARTTMEARYCTIVGDDITTATVIYNKPQEIITEELINTIRIEREKMLKRAEAGHRLATIRPSDTKYNLSACETILLRLCDATDQEDLQAELEFIRNLSVDDLYK